MAINIVAKLENYECRNVSERTTKARKPFRVVRTESPNADYTCEVSVWDENLFQQVDNLSKGDICDFYIRVSADADYQGVSLVEMSNKTTNDYGY